MAPCRDSYNGWSRMFSSFLCRFQTFIELRWIFLCSPKISLTFSSRVYQNISKNWKNTHFLIRLILLKVVDLGE